LMPGGKVTQERPPRALRIHASIAHDLGVKIVTGVYQPGDVLPGEIAFAETLSISRSAYREAVRMLMAKGLVESRPKAGTSVSPRSRWNLLDPDVLAWMFEGAPSEAFIRSLFELRMIVEPAAAALAAERRSGRELAQMGHALEEMGKHSLATPKGRAADQAFHHLILAASRNEPLTSLSSTISAAVGWTTIFKQRNRKLPRDPLPDHQLLYDAIVDANPVAARAAMGDLISRALADTELAMEP